MIIRFWWNSFIQIFYENSSIVCDPWVNEILPGYGWLPSETFTYSKVLDSISSCDYLYISHLHYDHLDERLLIDALAERRKDNLTIIIPKLNHSHLYSKLSPLRNLNISINEINPFIETTLSNGLSVTLIPHMTESSSCIDGSGYQIDSSIIFKDLKSGSTFFNTVDNPLSPDDFSFIMQKLSLDSITLATKACGSASQYPQSFLDIDRLNERSNVLNKMSNRAVESINCIKASYFIDAGGSYRLPDRLSCLEPFKACFNPSDYSLITPSVTSEQLSLSLNEQVVIGSDSLTVETLSSNFRTTSSDSQPLFPSPITFPKLDITFHQLLDIAARHFYARLSLFSSQLDFPFALNIYAYDELLIDSSASKLLITSDYSLYYTLESNNSISTHQKNYILDLHVEKPLLFSCLLKKVSWNTALTSSAIICRRSPNVYKPILEHALNFLVC